MPFYFKVLTSSVELPGHFRKVSFTYSTGPVNDEFYVKITPGDLVLFITVCNCLTDGDCLIGEVEVVVAGPSCDRSRQVTDVCSGTESSVSPNSDMSESAR